MATSTATYTTFNGLLMSEDRDGVETFYTSDPLGNLIECRNFSGTKTYSAEYWPYGELQTSTGTNSSPWGFVGLLGYFVDLIGMFYVRSRYFLTNSVRWLTLDPLWPNSNAYGYGKSAPVQNVDPSGLIPALVILAGCTFACGACFLCAALVTSPCEWCHRDPQCNLQCMKDTWENLPLWAKILCGGGCAGCIACLFAWLWRLVAPILARLAVIQAERAAAALACKISQCTAKCIDQECTQYGDPYAMARCVSGCAGLCAATGGMAY